ncbi:MAG: type II toxin-antitoxin system VapC family toxin [Candidatus Sulfotelmatobacter sp.]
MSRIYWDTMLFIYWLEDHRQYGPRVREIFQKMSVRNDQLCTSSFAVGETLVGFYKRGALDTASQVRDFFRDGAIDVIPYTLEMADSYADIRAKHGVSSADAIHLACAASAKTDLFLTNDKNLVGKYVPGIQFIAPLDTPLL